MIIISQNRDLAMSFTSFRSLPCKDHEEYCDILGYAVDNICSELLGCYPEKQAKEIMIDLGRALALHEVLKIMPASQVTE